MRICVYGASSNDIDKEYIKITEDFGRKLAGRGHSLVFGGGATGLMGAAARGVFKGGGQITGVAPRYFDRPGILFADCTEMIYTDMIGERKAILEERADAFVMLPGGIGTFDEFFGSLVRSQLGESQKPIAVFNIKGYYSALEALMDKAQEEGFMYAKCRKLYGVFNTAEEVINYIENSK